MALPPSIELLLRQGQRNVGRINSRYGAIGGALQPYAGQVQSRYAGFEGNEQALGGAVAGSQTALGSQLGTSISTALQGIQAPGAAVSQYGGGTATTGAQAGQAIGGLSTAELGRLRGEGSAEAIYAAALPRLAALAGDAERRAYLSELATDLQDLSLREAESQVENARADREFRYRARQDRIEQQRYQRETRYKIKQDREQARRQRQLDRLAQAAARQEYGLDIAKLGQSQARIDQGAARIRLAQRRQNESERQFNAREARMQRQFQIRMAAAAKSGKKPNASLSAKYGYIVDSNGRPILGKNGKRIKIKSDSSAAPWGQ